MEGLLRRLTSDGSEAENALRVIAFFDRLVEARGDLDELVRSCARLIGAPAGLIGDSFERSIAYTQFGRPTTVDPPAGSHKKAVASDSVTLGLAWIDGTSPHVSLGELVVERLAWSAAIIIGRRAATVAPPAVATLELLLSRDATPEDRASAARALGFSNETTIRALVLRTHRPLEDASTEMTRWAASIGTKITTPRIDGDLIVAIVADRGIEAPPVFDRVAGQSALGKRSPAVEAWESVGTARRAIRLTSVFLGPPSIDWEDLGPLTHLADLSPEQASSTPLVRKLIFLRQSETGRAELLALNAFCAYGSLRAAAARLNLHHSSLAHRLKNAESKLDVDLSDPSVVLRVGLALQLFRIATQF